MSDFSDAQPARAAPFSVWMAWIGGMPFVLDIPFAIIYFVISSSNQ
jgi:hypothetical protein